MKAVQLRRVLIDTARLWAHSSERGTVVSRALGDALLTAVRSRGVPEAVLRDRCCV